MPADHWNVTVEDSVEAPPYTLVGDILVVVRTPRSDDFVTVEVGRLRDGFVSPPQNVASGVRPTSRPTPWLNKGWSGEVHVGRHQAVAFELDGEAYWLSLEHIDTTRCRLPWGSYQFRLERQTAAPSGQSC